MGHMYFVESAPLTTEKLDLRKQVFIISHHSSRSAYTGYAEVTRQKCGGACHDMIKFHGPIGQSQVQAFCACLDYLNECVPVSNYEDENPIYVEITSGGGSVNFGTQMGNAVANSKRPVFAISSGICASAATFPFMAAKAGRMVEPASTFLIHDISSFDYGQTNLTQKLNRARNLETVQMAVAEEFYEHKGVNQDLLDDVLNGVDQYMNTQDCLNSGIAQGVWRGFDHPSSKPQFRPA